MPWLVRIVVEVGPQQQPPHRDAQQQVDQTQGEIVDHAIAFLSRRGEN